MIEEIKIKKAILHILDSNVTMPVISNRELDIDGDISDFLNKHINKIFKDNNMKMAQFSGENNKVHSICKELSNDEGFFLQASIEIAEILFGIMLQNVDIADADLICCLFEYNLERYFGILKLNYKSGFTHYVIQSEEGNENTIIKHKALLPSESQKVDECALINLDNENISLIEKVYEINGEKDYYFSKHFLHCITQLSGNDKVKILDKVTQQINSKYFDESYDTIARIKMAASASLEETGSIQVDNLIEEVFSSNIDIQKEYISEIQKAGLKEKIIPIPEKLAEKKFKIHKIKTDDGIEINFPLGYYNNKEKIEFINNPDGSISIIIKNVGKIIDK